MKTLKKIIPITIIILIFTIYHFSKDEKYIFNETYYKFQMNGDSTLVVKTEEKTEVSDERAYWSALLSYHFSIKYDSFNKINSPVEYRKDSIISFELLNSKKRNIAEKLTDKIKDSLLKSVKKAVQKSIIDLQKSYNKPIKITNEEAKALLSSWNGSLPSLVEYTKNNLHNPNSFDHLETGISNKGSYLKVRMIYSAENGFGAIRKSSIFAKVDAYGNIIEILSQ